MEIRFYTRELNFLGIIENQSSLIWNRKFFEPGTFELHCPITDFNRSLIKIGNLVWIRGAVESGIIESIVMEQSKAKKEFVVRVGSWNPTLTDD